MSIYGMMRTGVSGMNAQGTRLSGVAENVANANTIGYKRTDVQFSNYVVPSGDYAYVPGGVRSHVGHDISISGPARATGRMGDVMIDGNGFFRVADENGVEYLTRAGSFSRDKDGYVRNVTGHYLLDEDGQRIQIKGGPTDLFGPEVTTKIDFKVNFDASAMVLDPPGGDIDPSDPESYNHKKSVTTYDSQGKQVQVEFYMRKTDDNEWTVDAYVGDEQVGTTNLVFDKDGNLKDPVDDFKLTLPESDGANGTFEVDVNMGGVGKDSLVTQVGNLSAFEIEADGMESGAFDGFTFGRNGEIEVRYTNHQMRVVGYVGMTTVTSPESLTVLSGSVFGVNSRTGGQMMGRPGDGVFGSLYSGYLEDSNVEMSDELTDMIEAQRSYTANSKVFQTGSELMDVIVNLKR